MCFKRNLSKEIRNVRYQLKGIGGFILIPIVGLYILTPLSNIIVYLAYQDMDLLYDNILKESQFFFPLLSVWYTFFILQHCIEEPGHDLLYIHNRNKLFNILLPFMIYLVMLIPLFIVYTNLFPILWWLYIKIAVICLFYQSVTYVLAFLCGKISLSIIAILLYTIYVIASIDYTFFNISYYSVEVLPGFALLNEMKFYILMTILLFFCGSICNYYYPERNR